MSYPVQSTTKLNACAPEFYPINHHPPIQYYDPAVPPPPIPLLFYSFNPMEPYQESMQINDITENHPPVDIQSDLDSSNQSNSESPDSHYIPATSQRHSIKRHHHRHHSSISRRKLIDPRMKRESFNRTLTNTSDNVEFDEWTRYSQHVQKFRVVREIKGDLFRQPVQYALAHCVAEDMRMSSGIATTFKYLFGNVSILLEQQVKSGGLATIYDQQTKRFIYYLVTKKESIGKPTFQSLFNSLKMLKQHMNDNKVKSLAMPRIGCGLDRLEWNKVKSMIEFVFSDDDIDILICNYHDLESPEIDRSKRIKLIMEDDLSVDRIDCGTLIFYFTTVSLDEDDCMQHLGKRFNFLPDFRQQRAKYHQLGDIIYYEDKEQNYGLCGLVVKESFKSRISYESLRICLKKFNQMNLKFGIDQYQYVSFQWVDEVLYCDNMINQKIITVMLNYLKNVALHVCRAEFTV